MFLVHPDPNLPQMMLGVDDPARFAQGLTVRLIGIPLVVASWLAISYLSLLDIRTRNASSSPCWSRFVRRGEPNGLAHPPSQNVTEKDVSPYRWRTAATRPLKVTQ